MARTKQQRPTAHKQAQAATPHSHGPGHSSEHGHEEHAGLGTYFAVFAVLMVLLVATVWVSYFDMGAFFNVSVALAIAFTKMVLIILYFMHVKYSPRIIWLAATAAFFWLGIMFVLTFSDYISRPWVGIPGK